MKATDCFSVVFDGCDIVSVLGSRIVRGAVGGEKMAFSGLKGKMEGT